MNLFEKIFNYQILSRLEGSGTFVVTSHERAWLKTMLQHPAAEDAFTAETLEKLREILGEDQVMDTSEHLIEKARSMEKQVYHPLLRPLRRYIMERAFIRLAYGTKSGSSNEAQLGFPYRLEYSMIKREWYLLWYNVRSRTFMQTKLDKIYAAEPVELTETEQVPAPDADTILHKINQFLESRKTEVLIEVVPAYNRELSRILYALSSFEKDVEYDAEQDRYRVRVCLQSDEREYLLSKIRFLGMRVRVVEGDYLKRRMLEAATKALARYGVE
ncbi:WYL domain-containing protein [Paenibacillus sp. MMS18-CY102]|uniref:WYL domain-containing protein n=1 Tax=Paenibacillus sp. MMS18-CY102 TaxID=2682849 RepID=UPI001365F23C|nr:WYL domain-containing protein [Paenibacillus sp. MMS18-CY102]MWC27699.1 WYL domain-containing protein [Paenibacillus sp. MMS18-CY102]